MSNATIFDNQIKLKDVEELLLLGMNINLPVFMLSGPGRGKSSIVKQFADKYFNGKMQTLILSRIESSDLALPIPTKNEDGTYSTHFAISELLPKEPCVLFLDDFSQISPSCQCIIQQLLLEGSFMHYELPKGTYVVLAGNRTQDNANSCEVLSTIANRCIMCEIKEDEQEFLEYAEEQNISPNWFSMGIHEKALEIYTAEEHDEYEFHGSMGQICEEKADINQFVSSVAKQNQYYRKKSEE